MPVFWPRPPGPAAVIDTTEAMRAAGRATTPMADLSRGVVGVIGKSLVVNVPGSPKAATESLAAIEPTLGHALEAEYPGRVTAVQLMRNYGQHNALMAGFRHARGEVVRTHSRAREQAKTGLAAAKSRNYPAKSIPRCWRWWSRGGSNS